MIPENIDTGLEDPEAAFRAVASNVLPLLQLASISNINYQLAASANYLMTAWHPLGQMLATHAEYKNSHRDMLRQLDRLVKCLEKLAAKEGATPDLVRHASSLAHSVKRLRSDYHERYILRRDPRNTYQTPLKLVTED